MPEPPQLVAELNVDLLIEAFEKKLGLRLRTLSVIINPNILEEHQSVAALRGNKLELHPVAVNDGYSIAEEIGHSLRKQLGPKEEEIITQEFFGFLGRKIAYESLTTQQRKFLRMRKPPIFGMETLKEHFKAKKEFTRSAPTKRIGIVGAVMDAIRQISEKGKPNYDATQKARDEARAKLRSYVLHYRGYKYASRVNLSNIPDLRALYSMPNREVRIRFFRQNPLYTDPIPATPKPRSAGKKKKASARRFRA